jgi:hypothetical protein
MTEERLVLTDLLEKAGDGDFLRAVAEAVLQLLMESDVEGMIGTSARPFVLPPAASRACRSVSSLRIIPRARPT